MALKGRPEIRQLSSSEFSVVAGLVPAIHVFVGGKFSKDVDARHKAGHDEPGKPPEFTLAFSGQTLRMRG
jgi:hypothetical protein